MICQYPTITMQEIYHIGTLNPKDKQHNSHEGAGLSFTTHPEAWRRITPLFGDLYQLEKTSHAFLDFHQMTNEQINNIYQWGVENHYIVPATLYRVEHFDDEMDSLVYSDYETKEEAEMEAEGYEEEVKVIQAYLSTEKMKEKTLNQSAPVMILDLLATIFVEEALQIDGVWWNDLLDVYRYSAPRGVITPNNIKSWKFIKKS